MLDTTKYSSIENIVPIIDNVSNSIFINHHLIGGVSAFRCALDSYFDNGEVSINELHMLVVSMCIFVRILCTSTTSLSRKEVRQVYDDIFATDKYF